MSTVTPLRASLADNLSLGFCEGPHNDTRIIAKGFHDIRELLQHPKPGSKDGAYFLRGLCNGPRRDAGMEHCSLVILDGDSTVDLVTGEIRNGAPDPNLVHAALVKHNIGHIIYSSYSNTLQEPRYRVLLFHDSPSARHLRAAIDWTINLLHEEGVRLNSVGENYRMSQPWYIPRTHKDSPPHYYKEFEGTNLPTERLQEWFDANEITLPENHQPGPNSSTFPSDLNQVLNMIALSNLYQYKYTRSLNGHPCYCFKAYAGKSGSVGLKVFHHQHHDKWIAYSHHGDHCPISAQRTVHGNQGHADYRDLQELFKDIINARVEWQFGEMLRDLQEKALQPLDHQPEFLCDTFDIARRVDDSHDPQKAADYIWNRTNGNHIGFILFLEWCQNKGFIDKDGKGDKRRTCGDLINDKFKFTDYWHWKPDRPHVSMPHKGRAKVSSAYLAGVGIREYGFKKALMGEYIASILLDGKTYYVTKGRKEIGNIDYSYPTFHALQEHYSNRYVAVLTKGEDDEYSVKYSELFPLFAKSAYRHAYTGWAFDPIPHKYVMSSKIEKTPVLNVFLGLAQRPAPAPHQLIKNHIFDVLCNRDNNRYGYLICWLAKMFQQPHKPGEIIIGFRSVEGTGKTIVLGPLAEAWGIHGWTLSRRGDVLGRFNDHLGRCIMVNMNEALFGGNKQEQSQMKALITDENLVIERKHMPIQNVRNRLHITMSSNEDWMAAVGDSDRRHVFFEPSARHVDNRKYFKDLKDEIRAGGINGFIHWLLSLDLTGFQVRDIDHLVSETKRSLKVKSANTFEQWLLYSIEEGALLGGEGRKEPLKEKEKTKVLNDDIRYLYEGWYKNTKIRGDFIHSAVSRGKSISKLLKGAVEKRTDGTDRRWEFEPLETLRDTAEKILNGKIIDDRENEN